MNKSKYLIHGAIPASFIAEVIENHFSKKDIGGHDLFLGQVRDDIVNGKRVKLIDYSAYDEMIDTTIKNIKDEAFAKYDQLKCMHIKHSVGPVKAGELSLFVMVSSAHRKQAFDACQEVVEKIKYTLPVWKKEVFDDDSYIWTEPEKK